MASDLARLGRCWVNDAGGRAPSIMPPLYVGPVGMQDTGQHPEERWRNSAMKRLDTNSPLVSRASSMRENPSVDYMTEMTGRSRAAEPHVAAFCIAVPMGSSY